MGVKTVTQVGGGSASPPLVDGFSLNITAADGPNNTPTSDELFNISAQYDESNVEGAQDVLVSFPAGNFTDANDAPVDARTTLLRVWLSGSAGTGVSNPGNADGSNDAVRAVVQTAALGPTTETLTSNAGSSIGTITFSTVTYRGWFNWSTTLITSTVQVIARSSSALFTDIVMLTGSGLGASGNFDDGSFTFDLLAAGVDTLAKLQSVTILHQTTDAAAGVTPCTINVDAGALDVTAVI